MAILAQRQGLLFIQPPDTGSSALGKAMLEQLDGRVLPETNVRVDGRVVVDTKHGTLADLLRYGVLSQTARNQLVCFSIVRNPFDRWVGIYSGFTGRRADRYLEDRSSFLHSFGTPGSVDQFREVMHIARAEGFDRWLDYHIGTLAVVKRVLRFGRAGDTRRAWAILQHLLRGSTLDYDLDDYARGVDRVLRTETLESGFDELLRSVGHPSDVTLERINVSEDRVPYQSYFSPRSRRLVEKRCGRFLKAYGYSFETPRA